MKAHIAKNQFAGTPTVLAWNLSAGDQGKLAGMAPAFGMRVVHLTMADAGKTVAQLLGEPGGPAPAELPAPPADTPALLLAGFRRQDAETLVDLLGQAQVNAPLKALETPTNRRWTFASLLAHLAAEHAAYTAAGKKEAAGPDAAK